MSIFSFIITKNKSFLIEKDRYSKHDLIKMDDGFYIYSRQQAPSIIDHKGNLNSDFLKFIYAISNEVKSDIYFSINDLKNKERQDLIESITDKSILIPSNNCISFGVFYRYPYYKLR